MRPQAAHRRTPRRVLLGLVSLLLTVGGLLAGTVPAQADEAPKVLLLLDVSGSMNARLDGGQTKFAAAKKALKRVAAALPAGTQVGLRVYGADVKEEQDENPAACRDTRLVLPVGPLDRGRMTTAVDSFEAQGATPIAYSMGKAVDDLGDSGKRVLILISDGQETCAKDPCPIARKLADRGVDLQFNAIGLAVGSTARRQLQCIAKAGGGTYSDAGDSGALDRALRTLTQRALRPFEVAGTPVTGTPDPVDAPQVAPGQYRDTYDTSGTPRYYTIPRTPGSLVTAHLSTVVKPYGSINGDQLGLELQTSQGETCSSGSSLTQALKSASVFSVVVRSEGSESPRTRPDACTTDPQLRLEVTRTTPASAPDSRAAVELGIDEQPAVLNRADLPGPVEGYTGLGRRVAGQKPVKPVVGGSGFSNAPTVATGSWSDSIAFGDTALYTVPVDHGQTLKVTASLPGEKGRLPLSLYDAYTVHLRLITPARTQLVEVTDGRTGGTAVHLSAASPQVRVRNDEIALPTTQNFQPDASTATVAGDYVVAVELEPVTPGLRGVVLPLQLDVKVDGAPSGQPVFATGPTPSASAAPSASDSPSAPPVDGPVSRTGASALTLVLAGAGGVVVLALASAAAVLVVRRRRSARRPGS